VSAGTEALRDELALTCGSVDESEPDVDDYRAYADALLAPDGPLYPALRALGLKAMFYGRQYPPHEPRLFATKHLADRGITGPLADACLAAAEDPS